jgi:hypothetical protein
MSNPSYIVFSALVIISVFYGHGDQWPLGRLGSPAVSAGAAKSEAPAHRPLELAALIFALVALRWKCLRRGRDDHVRVSTSHSIGKKLCILNGFAE